MKGQLAITTPAQIVGAEISKRRKFARIKQKDLAAALGMKTPQLCKIEKGVNMPTPKLLARVEERLGLYPGSLVELRGQLVSRDERTAAPDVPGPLERLHASCDAHSIPDADLEKLAKQIVPLLDRYVELENELGLEHFCSVGLNDMRADDFRDGIEMAEALRGRLGLGDAPFADLLPALEQHNVRILFLAALPPLLPSQKIRHAFSFYDVLHDTPVVCVNRQSPPYSQLYNLAYEIGCCLRHRNRACAKRKPRRGYDESDFCRAFASTLLIPTAAVRDLVDTLRIAPGQWTPDLVDAVAMRFGVSALAMVWRLESIGRIDGGTSAIFKDKFHSAEWRMEHTHFAPRAPLPQDAWLKILTERAKIR